MRSTSTDIQIPGDVGAPVRAVLDLFEGPLAEVAFPDVDRARLRALVDAAAEAERAVEAARAALDAAQDVYDDALSSLAGAARRGHAYARIYAQGDAPLTEALDAIPIAPKEAKKRKGAKPRRRKAKGDGPELPLAERAGVATEAA